MSASSKIIYTSAQNIELTKKLAETDYAASALEQISSYIAALNAEIQKRENELKWLQSRVVNRKDDHEKYQNSTMRRIAYKMSGKEKFAEAAAKEEREYYDAMQAHHRATTQLEQAKGALAEAEPSRAELEKVQAIHETAQKELDLLYDSVFAGPTPEFPDDDPKERVVGQAKAVFDKAQSRVSAEPQVISILQDADKAMERCRIALANLSDWFANSQDGGYYATEMFLTQAQTEISQVLSLFSQARSIQPTIDALGQMDIAKTDNMSNIIFDNVFSDISFTDRLKDGYTQILVAKKQLQSTTQQCKERELELKSESDHAKGELAFARKELHDFRATAFAKVAGGLPEYAS